MLNSDASNFRRVLLFLCFALLGCVPAGSMPGADTGADTAERAAGLDASVARAANAAAATELELRFLDVGQGDGLLVRSWEVAGDERRQGPVALVDAGPVNRIVSQLRALGVDHIDLLLASHNHLDHIGGMDAILDSLPVRFYLDNGHPATTRIQRRVLERVESQGVTYLEAQRRSIALGTAQLHVLPPPPDVGGDEQNNRSVSVVIEHRGFRALLTGDAEVQLLNTLLESADIPQVQVLKASHHGSRNGVTPAWLSRTQPDLVVISVGEGNQYGHPHDAALRFYCAGGRRVLRTDLHGDIIIAVDTAGNYSVSTGRGTAAEPGQPPPNDCAR